MAGQRDQAGEVLAFWFGETLPRQWFAKDAVFDALVLLLDQLPRQIWRDTAMAFAGDPQALAESLQAVERGWLEAEPEQARRQFWLMPLLGPELDRLLAGEPPETRGSANRLTLQ
jgi:uncharacterized protein (DUF924 family)